MNGGKFNYELRARIRVVYRWLLGLWFRYRIWWPPTVIASEGIKRNVHPALHQLLFRVTSQDHRECPFPPTFPFPVYVTNDDCLLHCNCCCTHHYLHRCGRNGAYLRLGLLTFPTGSRVSTSHHQMEDQANSSITNHAEAVAHDRRRNHQRSRQQMNPSMANSVAKEGMSIFY